MEITPIDIPAAHRQFSTDCFNQVWELLDKPNRNTADNEKMVALAHASVWHWTERVDCTRRNLSIGYWQTSRVYATIGHGERAAHYGKLCLDLSRDEEPFYLAYAHEALARAAVVSNNLEVMQEHLRLARQLAPAIVRADDRSALEADLDSIKGIAG